MDKEETGHGDEVADMEKEFLSDPLIAGNLDFLGKIGVLSRVGGLMGRIRDYRTLFSVGMEMFDCASVDDILDVTVRRLSSLYLPSFIAFLWKPVQNSSDITMRSYRHPNYEPAGMGLRLGGIARFESFFCGSPEPIALADLERALGNDADIALLGEARPEIIVPIVGPFDLYGLVLVGRKTGGDDYTAEEMGFLRQLTPFVSQAVRTHLFYEHSLRDIKTGLYNHGFFMTRVKEEVARARRGFCSSSIIMVDVDRFKNFNDTYGHLAGDRVLETLAKVILQNVRTDDIPSRFGGEEFTVLLPNTESTAACLIAERLRISVAEMEVSWETPLPSITISLGVFAFDQDCDLETYDIIRRADEALYTSKARGRNCTTLWEPGLQDPPMEGSPAGEATEA